MEFKELVPFIRDYWPMIIATGVVITPVLWFVIHYLHKRQLETLRGDYEALARTKESRGQEASQSRHNGVVTARKYDVFLSSVLAGFSNDSRLLQEKQVALAVKTCLEQECKFTVYYAGGDVQSAADFDRSHLGAKQDIAALHDSRYFLLLYPERVTSSVLFEAGFALNHCDASIYFVRDNNDLPYLMRRLPEAVAGVKTCTYRETEDILKVLRRHRHDLFREVAGGRSV